MQEYGYWVDKLMTVRHIDATRTTNLPAMEQADVLRPWLEHLGGAEEQSGGRYSAGPPLRKQGFFNSKNFLSHWQPPFRFLSPALRGLGGGGSTCDRGAVCGPTTGPPEPGEQNDVRCR